MNIEVLRDGIRELIHREQLRRDAEIDAAIEALSDDFEEAIRCGVGWHDLAALVSMVGKVPFTGEMLAEKMRLSRSSTESVRGGGDPVGIVSVPEAEAADEVRVDPSDADGNEKVCVPEEQVPVRQHNGYFIAAAITPDGRLFQLEHVSRVQGERGNKGYAVYEVDDNAGMHRCHGDDFPPARQNRIEAISAFCGWAKRMGCEVHPGEIFEKYGKTEEAGE